MVAERRLHMSDTIEHEYLSQEQLNDLQQCIEAQKRHLDNGDILNEYEETAISFECDSGGFVEVKRGADSGFIQITSRGGLSTNEFGALIDEVVRSVEETTPATPSVALTTDSATRYDITYSDAA